MKHTLIIDKRVAGIIRWLERMKQSYSSGAMESALMDAECARADLENLRQDVWSTVQPVESHGNKIFSHVIILSKAALLALIVTLLMVVPVAKDIPVPEPVNIVTNESEELVLAEPILIVRDYNEKTVTRPKKSAPVAKSSQAPRKSSVNTAVKVENNKREKVVAYDKVFSLVQTGQRALKNDKSVIEIK